MTKSTQSTKSIESAATEDFLGGIEEVSASGAGRKLLLIEEETRLKLFIDSMTIIGLEDYTGADGKTTTNYKIGLGFTSNREQKYEDGEGTGRKVTFFKVFTFSFHEKSGMVKSGLVEALVYDTSNLKLTEFLAACVGKQISAMISHRKYKNKQLQDSVAMDIEKFKKVVETEDFEDAVSAWEPPFMAVKLYSDKKIVKWSDLKERTAPKLVGTYIAGEVAKPGKIVDLA